MDITFRTAKLQKTFSRERALQKEYGDLARKIMQRVAVLKAAPTLADVSHLPPERRHELTGDRKGQFAVDVSRNDRIIFEPANNPIPMTDDGGVDLSRVTDIRIICVEDYH